MISHIRTTSKPPKVSECSCSFTVLPILQFILIQHAFEIGAMTIVCRQVLNWGCRMKGCSAPVSLLAQTEETCLRDQFLLSPFFPAHLSVHSHALPALHACTRRDLCVVWKSKRPLSKTACQQLGSRSLPRLSSCNEETLLDDCVSK